MTRYFCLEIRTSCGSCGQPVPVNGPMVETTCPSCFEKVTIPADIIAGFLNEFEEEYEGHPEGEGSGGTLMSGSGTYKYGVWRLTPRCSSCKKPLVIPESPGEIKCTCGQVWHFYESPEWLAPLVPSLKNCISRELPQGKDSPGEVSGTMPEDSLKPVVMSCPQCSGALSVSADSERIMVCGYCDSQVYIPDAVWQRLHPVKKVQEWFACLEGKTEKQLLAERRIRDREEEARELSRWKAHTVPVRIRRKTRPYLVFALGFILLYLLVAALLPPSSAGSYADSLIALAPAAGGALAVSVPVFMAFHAVFSAGMGNGRKCRKAMEALAASRGWEHKTYGGGPGEISETVRGREIEIHPAEEYALEVDMDESVFYLKTEPPGYPPEDMHRFTTGDSGFNGTFPFRYAEPETAARIENGELESLEPLMRFLERWGPRLGRLKIDWSSVAVHVTPGCYDVLDSGSRYVPPEDLEPLFTDTMKLAEELDALAK